jgi:prepilin-type N-terminal cleavage/methylation domain-containing protein/prepilin-type processing-associated H-X9-DG protein
MIQRSSRSGFTLVELLVVIAILGILVGLLLPAVQQSRASARQMSCSNNLKQIGVALQLFHDSAKHFPLGEPDDDNNGWSWRFWILPFLEESVLYDAAMSDPIVEYRPYLPSGMGAERNRVNIDFLTFPQQAVNTATGSTVPGGVAGTPIAVYACPADVLPLKSTHAYGSPSYWGPFAKSNYCGNIGSSPAWFAAQGDGVSYACGGSSPAATVLQTGLWNGMVTFSNHNLENFTTRVAGVTDGTSKTVIVGEVTTSLNCGPTQSATPVFPGWAGGAGTQQNAVTLTGSNGNNGGNNYCGYLPALGSVFRFMDGYYPPNSPPSVPSSDNAFGSQHSGGGNFLFVDGSVQYLSDHVDAVVYQAMGTRSGGEVFDGGN